MAGDASAIYIERPGPAHEGFEFSLETSGGTEYHQAKSQKTGEGRWTIGALSEAGVLKAFFDRLHSGDSSCVFVSGHAAYQLEELANRARKTDSFVQFKRDFLSSQTWRGHFGQLVAELEATDEWMWGALRRIQAETVGEQTLSESVAFRTEWLLDGAKDSASAALIEVLREALNERLTAQELWRRLEGKGYRPNPLASPSSAAVRLQAANERFRRSREGGRIAGRLISRTETAQLREALGKERVVLLEGAAGIGKSEVLSELIEGFEKDGTAYLAMRLDRRPAATFTAEELGAKLGLPASPPVTLAAAAASSPSYLIVDQLDAISTTSGRNPEFFDCVEEMLRLALSEPQTRIVLACRSFDAANDPRLRRLIDEQSEDSRVSVGPLPEQQVREALTELGVEAEAFRDDLIELLTVPLHLALMGQISARSSEDVAPLKTLNDLYGAFWDDKHREVRELLGREPRWTEVLDAVVDRMSEEPALEVPRDTIDDCGSDADAMLSSAVLVEGDGRLSFFHETFFDYAFARRFSSRRLTLEDLLAHDQLLFRRAQVRQVLAHARDSSPTAYEKDLRFLLDDASIRFHLKDLVLAWLGTVSDPRTVEWELIEPLLDGDFEPVAERARIALCSPQWFRFLHERGVLTDWLAAGGRGRERVQWILSAAGPGNGDRIAELLAPYESDADGHGFDLETVLVRSDLAESRDLFELLIKEIESGRDLGRRDFWYLAHELPEQRPEWACELLGTYLSTRLAAGELMSVGSSPWAGTRLMPEGLHLREYVTAAARGAPAAFIEHVWPVMVDVIEQMAGPARDDRPRHDQIWNLRHFSDGPGDLDDDLLAGAEIAMEGLATTEPAKFVAMLEEQTETPYETVVFLLFCGLSANPEVFADRAIAFLLADQRRLRVSYSDGDHWATRKLLEAITPAASQTAMERLEAELLDYYTPWERSVDGYKQFGLAQFELLGGVGEARTPAMAKRFAELQRKFEREDAWTPSGIRAGMVGPPIPEDAARKMNDANWVRAMKRYASEDHRSERDFLKGGARELASVLEKLCGEDPTRFARLGVTLSDEINSAYFDAILRGMGNSEQRPELVDAETLIVRCHRLPGRPCGRWIGHPLRAHAREEISKKLLKILGWYATEGDGPSSADFGERSEEEQLLMQGLNSVRGGMADELGRLIDADPALIAPLEETLRRLCQDKSMAVRTMAAGAVLGVLAHDQDLGLDLFLEMIDGADDILLATRYARRFLVHRGAYEFDALEPVIRRMVASPVAAVRTDGAGQAALISLSIEDARSLAEECVNGTPEMRLGAAKAFADNLQDARFQGRCEERLVALFGDEDEGVRKAAAGAVSRLRPEEVGNASDMIEAFLETPAFEEDPEAVLRALDGATSAGVKLSLAACERTVDILESSPEARRLDRGMSDASEVAVRAYADAANEAEKNRALDVIDRALALNAYGARRALQEHDRG